MRSSGHRSPPSTRSRVRHPPTQGSSEATCLAGSCCKSAAKANDATGVDECIEFIVSLIREAGNDSYKTFLKLFVHFYSSNRDHAAYSVVRSRTPTPRRKSV